MSLALTTGPHQPEYTSYEDAGATDMVNLLTGDFVYNMPLIDVPTGMGSSFTVPLSYHAGIGMDQEASWVGLGWNVNVGAITRNINGFPDDASGEPQTINVKDLTDRRGWYSNFMGWNMGWDSQQGHYGSINAGGPSLDWDKNGYTAGSNGIFVGQHGRVDAAELAASIVRMAAAFATKGASEVVPLAKNIGMEIFKQAGRAMSFSAPRPPGTNGYWSFSKREDSKLLGLYTNYWFKLDHTRVEDMYGSLFLDKALPETLVQSPPNDFVKLKMNINGTNQPTIQRFPASTKYANKGAASDINIDLSTPNYINNHSPTTLAYDRFYVNAPGISGGIKPYRLEVGSVSVPREMTSKHIRLNPVPFLDYGSNKVPFVYEGTIGNRYFNHVGTLPSNTSVTSPFFHYGITSTLEPNGVTGYDNNNDVLRHDHNDLILNNTHRIRPDINERRKLPQGDYIDWLSNEDIKNTSTNFTGTSYLDYFKGSARQTFRSSYQFGASSIYYGTSASAGIIELSPGQNLSTVLVGQHVDVNVITDIRDEDGNVIYMSTNTYPNVEITSKSSTQIQVDNSSISMPAANGHVEFISKNEPKPGQMIGGFVITSADGMSYHFALPVYDYDLLSSTADKDAPTTKYSTTSRSGQFANTWLLTAITGPDFVDRGGSFNNGDGYVDENDWGYWIKFNYGSQSSDYMWRLPYAETIRDSENKHDSYAKGLKEKYYLNSVETKSHVALFIKDGRVDAKDASLARKPSLRLAEIALLTKDAYRQLTNPSDIYQLQDCSGSKDVLYQYNGSSSSQNISGNKASFIQTNAIKRVMFNVSNVLCQGALNSDNGQGKLTLESVSFLGKNNAKVLPDYKFTYGINPSYDANRWDGWGMYSSEGTSAGNSHKVSPNPDEAEAWSLVSIISPLGNSINIDYERDTYSSISGERTLGTAVNWSNSSGPSHSSNVIPANTDGFSVGDLVKVEGSLSYYGSDNVQVTSTIDLLSTITAINTTNNTITIEDNYYSMTGPPPLTIESLFGTIAKVVSKSGGNLRVGAIEVTDPDGFSFKTRYLYNQNNGLSSGVVSMEPDYIRHYENEYPFYSLLGYPATPVFYGKVTVLSGKLTNDSDYITKQEFEFETPNSSLYTTNSNPLVKDKEQIKKYVESTSWPPARFEFYDYSTLAKFEIQKRTSRIGKMKSMKVFDNNEDIYSEKTFIYTPNPLNESVNNNQGRFSEGTLMHEIIVTPLALSWDGVTAVTEAKRYHKAQRTTVVDFPYVLQKVITTVDGRGSETENTNWDLITGNVIETTSLSASGERTKSVAEPLYKITAPGYQEFGSKAVDPSYRNMLNEVAAVYHYKLKDNGAEDGLIGANASMWKKDWDNYRVLENGKYENRNDISDLDNDGTIELAEIASQQVWRKYANFTWKGDYTKLKKGEGTYKFSQTDKFNFSSPDATLWQQNSVIERYSHHSYPLETYDINNIYSSSKLGYDGKVILASAENAKYEEIAFSGAEDRSSVNLDYFGGEVAVGSSPSTTVVSSPVHTGKKALSLSTGYGFIFKSSGIIPNEKYKASVWVNNANGRIYYKVNGTEYSPAPGTTPGIFGIPSITQGVLKKDGTTWYRIDYLFEPGNVTSIEVGVKSANGTTVVFDDFRFQPFESSMSCSVYDPISLQLEYQLDNDNLFTRYQYNDRGLLIKTYAESVSYGEKLISESSDNYKRFHVNE